MKTFPIPVRVEDEPAVEQKIRTFLVEWVGLLASRKFREAIEPLSPEIPPGSGSVDLREGPQWTPTLMEAVIANYGTAEPWESGPQSYAVAPLGSSLAKAFDENVRIDFDRDAIIDLSRDKRSGEQRSGWLASKFSQLGLRRNRTWVGSADFDLPINFISGNRLSDLSARMLFKPIANDQMVLVLLDIHVL